MKNGKQTEEKAKQKKQKMATKTVDWCDDCDDQIAPWKCAICGKDLCEDCQILLDSEDWLNLNHGGGQKFFLLGKEKDLCLCSDCEDEDLLNPEGKFMKEFLEEIKFEEQLKEKVDKALALRRLEK